MKVDGLDFKLYPTRARFSRFRLASTFSLTPNYKCKQLFDLRALEAQVPTGRFFGGPLRITVQYDLIKHFSLKVHGSTFLHLISIFAFSKCYFKVESLRFRLAGSRVRFQVVLHQSSIFQISFGLHFLFKSQL